MNLPRFSPRERHLMLLTAVVLLVSGLVSWILLPGWGRLTSMTERADLTQEKLARLQALVKERPRIEQDYQRYADLVSDEPAELLQRGFLDELDQLAQASGLQLNLKPRPAQRDAQVSRLTVEMDAEGTQEALLAFLDRLLAAPILIEVDRLRLSASPSSQSPLRTHLVVAKLVLRPVSPK